MAESGIHVREILRLIALLDAWFRDQWLVHVGGNILLYWEQGNTRRSVSPDVFVVKGLAKEPPLPVYLVWEHGPPAVAYGALLSVGHRQSVPRLSNGPRMAGCRF